MLTLAQLCSPAVPIELKRRVFMISPLRLWQWSAWLEWLKENHVATVERQVAELPADERAELVAAAREHARKMTPHSPEGNEALARPGGQLAFVSIALQGRNVFSDTGTLANMLDTDDLARLVAAIVAFNHEHAPEVTDKAGDAVEDFGPLMLELARAFGYTPTDVAELTPAQVRSLVDGLTGQGETVHPKTGRRMRKFASREEAAAFIAERKAQGIAPDQRRPVEDILRENTGAPS